MVTWLSSLARYNESESAALADEATSRASDAMRSRRVIFPVSYWLSMESSLSFITFHLCTCTCNLALRLSGETIIRRVDGADRQKSGFQSHSRHSRRFPLNRSR